MKTKFKGKVPRTSGWQTQWEYDNLLADLDVSSLCFLNDDYRHKIKEFPMTYSLSDPETQHQYQLLLQEKKMIEEELDVRFKCPIYEKRFDSTTGLVLDEDGNIMYSMAYSQNEDQIVYLHDMNDMGTPIEEDDETDYTYYKYHNRTEMYRMWDYTKDLNEQETT